MYNKLKRIPVFFMVGLALLVICFFTKLTWFLDTEARFFFVVFWIVGGITIHCANNDMNFWRYRNPR
ncbi:hypothetical protein DNAM_660 [Pseudomonas phage BroderSalsa]|nr:hypothetical protein DNAM_660 [Pseudomonas phage BroderSalsa]